MRIVVYHDINIDASMGLNCVFTPEESKHKQYRSRSHELVRVFEFDSAQLPGLDDLPPSAAAETLFRAFNVGDEPGYAESTAEFDLAVAYRACRLRSLSVGDVVRLGDRQYLACESMGWFAHEEGELNILGTEAAEAAVRERYGFKPAEELSLSVPLREADGAS